MHICATLLLSLGFFNVTHVWTEPPHVPLFPDSARSSAAQDDSETLRLYAARGERESFQIAIQSTRQTLEEVRVEAGPVSDGIPAPELWRVGYIVPGEFPERRMEAHRDQARWPDPLLPLEPFRAEAGETVALWVTYAIEQDARPGVHRGRIEIYPDRGRKREIEVAIEVFDFAIPERPSLETAFRLDRRAIQDVYGWDDGDLAGWRTVYDAILPYRLGFNIWDGAGMVQPNASGGSGVETFQDHLEHVAGAGAMASLNLGQGPLGIAAFPEPVDREAVDPLRPYLRAMTAWLEEREWLDRAFVHPVPALPRDKWREARWQLFRVRRADSRVRRLWTGPIHPYMERYAELWAAPLRHYDYWGHQRLSQGLSLVSIAAPAAASVTASSSGSMPEGGYASMPEDGYDGSLHSAWRSAAPPTPSEPAWLQVTFEEPVTAERFAVAWRPGHEPGAIRVRTSFDGRVFNNAQTEWTHHLPIGPHDESWSEGQFAMQKQFRAIRLEFASSRHDAPVAVAALQMGDAAPAASLQEIPPVDVWLAAYAGDFPDLAPGLHPIEARLFPWVCYGHNTTGFLGGNLNRWPREWAFLAQEAPLEWPHPGNGGQHLFYPGPEGLLPSIRAEQIRAGMEDYEYLAALAEALAEGELEDDALSRLAGRRLYTPSLEEAHIAGFADRIREERTTIGRALARVTERRNE